MRLAHRTTHAFGLVARQYAINKTDHASEAIAALSAIVEKGTVITIDLVLED